MRLVRKLAARILRNQILTRLADRPGCVYLTFDDGPSEHHTRRVLDVLDLHGAKGTFFMVGREVQQWPAVAREVVARGHALGNHTLTHPRMDRMSNPARQFEIEQMASVLNELGAHPDPLFRPPYGHMSPGLLLFCLRHRHVVAYWSRDSFDFRLSGPEVVREFRERPVAAGDIVLFHDDGSTAADALAELLPMWSASGFTFPSLTLPARH